MVGLTRIKSHHQHHQHHCYQAWAKIDANADDQHQKASLGLAVEVTQGNLQFFAAVVSFGWLREPNLGLVHQIGREPKRGPLPANIEANARPDPKCRDETDHAKAITRERWLLGDFAKKLDPPM